MCSRIICSSFRILQESTSFIFAGLKDCMRKGYSYVEGIEELLHSLKDSNYEMHAFTNYPIWLDENFYIKFSY